jgi:hypothetical protein
MHFKMTVAFVATSLAALCLAQGCSVHTTGAYFGDGGLLDDGGLTQQDAHVATGDSGKAKGSTPTSDGTACGDFCAKAAAADCPKQSSCQTDCESNSDQVPSKCTSAWTAVLDCAASSSGSFTGCDSKGKPKLEGCDDETAAFLKCLQGGSTKPDAGPQGGCGLTTGVAACDTCVDTNCCSQASACSNDTECLAILDCVANCNDSTCDTACMNAHPTGKTKEQSLVTCVSSHCSTECQ